MKSIMEAYSWLNIATSGIRFGPDRDAVREELAGHIEDRVADLMRVFPDIPEEEAGKRALDAMGDAWELKKELARVHKPWLGWLWRCTQILVWGLLVLILFAGMSGGADFLRGQWYDWQDRQEARVVGRALYEDGVPDWEGERLAVYRAEGEARLGRSTISVSRAARWRMEDGEKLYLRLRVAWDRPWETNQYAINFLWAEDDLGNTYEINAARSISEGWNWALRDLCLEGVPREAGRLYIHHTERDGLNLAVELFEEAES